MTTHLGSGSRELSALRNSSNHGAGPLLNSLINSRWGHSTTTQLGKWVIQLRPQTMAMMPEGEAADSMEDGFFFLKLYKDV